MQVGSVGLDVSNQSNDFDLWIKPSVLASIDVSVLPILTAYHRLSRGDGCVVCYHFSFDKFVQCKRNTCRCTKTKRQIVRGAWPLRVFGECNGIFMYMTS